MTKPKPDWTKTTFVSDFATAELNFPQATVIGLFLSEGETAGQNGRSACFRMTAIRARAIAKALIEAADTVDGTNATPQ